MINMKRNKHITGREVRNTYRNKKTAAIIKKKERNLYQFIHNKQLMKYQQKICRI